MNNREKAIRILEGSYKNFVLRHKGELLTVNELIALLKAQEISIEKVAEDYGLTPDGVSFALSQYQTVISEITHGMLSKLTYNAKDVLQTAQERWCDTCELLKAQEPRIVTEADFKNADEAGFIPAWCEEKDTAEVYCECISIGALEDAKFGHMRWWTSRPTDEQMEATPWPD